jgi:RHS repeat-associated protein
LGNRDGATLYHDGLLDEVVVFNDVLSASEIDKIRQGTYGSSAGTGELVYLQAITYNKRGQKATVRGPYPDDPNSAELAINYTQYRYDALGRLWQVEDAEGNVTTTRYYPDGKVWRVIDAEDHNVVTKYYNDDGSLKKVVDANDNATEYEYNGFMKVKKVTYPDDTSDQFSYDIYRRLSKKTTRSDQHISFTYDALGRIKTKDVDDTVNSAYDNTISYTYDLTGRLLEVTDDTGTIANTYDYAGRLVDVNYPGNRAVSYEYDDASNRTALIYPDDSYVTYEYDALSRLTKVRNDANTALAEYTYDARSRRTDLTYANGASIDYSYDTASRLLDINNVTDTYLEYAYTYDDVGNRLTMVVTDSSGAATHTYTYDDIYQLTDVNYPTDYDYLAEDTTLNYDDVGNRTSVVAGGTTNYSVNALNQYTSVGSDGYTYDDNGNLRYDGSFDYTYDPENRLVKVINARGDELAAACDVPRLAFTTGGDAEWFAQTAEYDYDNDAAQSGAISADEETWMQTTVEGSGSVTFAYKLSSATGATLSFYIDDQYTAGLSGSSSWFDSGPHTISGSGAHTLKWKYSKNETGSSTGDAWVDYIRWTGDIPEPPTSSGNDFSDDPNCVALWKLESGALTTDSIGSNTLTNDGTGASTSDYQEGAASGDFDRSGEDRMYIADGSLDSGFPLKNGDTNKKISIAAWVKFDELPTSGQTRYVAGKYDFTNSKRSLALSYYNNSGTTKIGILHGYNSGNSYERLEHASAIQTGRWYHVGVTYDDSDRSYRIRIWDDTAGAILGSDATGTASNAINVEDASFTVGCAAPDHAWHDGHIDEVVVFNDVLSASEIDKIRQGTYGLATSATWDEVEYTYDPGGRRIEKDVDGEVTKYVYDGDHCIAEYDGDGDLLRKYIYGPGVDQPICMIDVNDSNAVYYYHFDGLGSVVALSDSSGDTVQVYEYSVFGQVAASDPNHTNPFLFTGRRFDSETGLYYYRARYYNPYVGRFLQTDPIGYGDGMDVYAYCRNNPTSGRDPSGLEAIFGFLDLSGNDDKTLTFAMFSEGGEVMESWDFAGLGEWMTWAQDQVESGSGFFTRTWQESQLAWTLVQDGGEDRNELFWSLQALVYLTRGYEDFASILKHLVEEGVRIIGEEDPEEGPQYDAEKRTIRWDASIASLDYVHAGKDRDWWGAPHLALLAHEIGHAYDEIFTGWADDGSMTLSEHMATEMVAIPHENIGRYAFYGRVPGFEWVKPRPAYETYLHADVDWAPKDDNGRQPWEIDVIW